MSNLAAYTSSLVRELQVAQPTTDGKSKLVRGEKWEYIVYKRELHWLECF